MDQFLVVTTAALAQRLIRGHASPLVMAGTSPAIHVFDIGDSRPRRRNFSFGTAIVKSAFILFADSHSL
jgi:hypothetical protein